MNEPMARIIDGNTKIIGHIRKVGLGVLSIVTANADGTIDTAAKTAGELDRNIELMDMAVTHELKRRYGAK